MDNVHQLSVIKGQKEEESHREWAEECRSAMDRMFEKVVSGEAEFLIILTKDKDDHIPIVDMFSDDPLSITQVVGTFEVAKQNVMMVTMIASEYDE